MLSLYGATARELTGYQSGRDDPAEQDPPIIEDHMEELT